MTDTKPIRQFTCFVIVDKHGAYHAACEELHVEEVGATSEDAIGRLRRTIANTFPTDAVELIVDGSY